MWFKIYEHLFYVTITRLTDAWQNIVCQTKLLPMPVFW